LMKSAKRCRKGALPGNLQEAAAVIVVAHKIIEVSVVHKASKKAMGATLKEQTTLAGGTQSDRQAAVAQRMLYLANDSAQVDAAALPPC
jgi:hypothetical protein